MTFRVLQDHDDSAYVKCDNCNGEFWIDACTEENLEWSETKKSLITVCPTCNVRDDK